MKKKTLLLFLSAALACTMLTGCGGSSDDTAAPTVTDVSEGFWATGGGNQNGYRKAKPLSRRLFAHRPQSLL